jgi:hypothetical protein
MRLASPAVWLLLLSTPAVAAGQSFGLGGRLVMPRSDSQAETGAGRFIGGHIRARVSPRTAVEIGLDLRTTINDALTERLREYPIQASLLLFPVRTVISPYLLGGGGWYSRRTETLVDRNWVVSDSTRKFGWHGGFGAELQLGRHAAVHADYRYTFLRFGDDEEEVNGIARFLPSHESSMWTAGLTLYF